MDLVLYEWYILESLTRREEIYEDYCASFSVLIPFRII